MKCQQMIKSFLLLTQFAATCCFALGSIQIESDTARYDHQHGKMVHKGHVVVHWQDRVLTADELTLFKSESGEVSELVAIGNPATFDGQLTENSSSIQGNAEKIQFHLKQNTIMLSQKAELNYGGDLFEGPIIRFNFNNQSVYAEKSDSVRPKLIFGATSASQWSTKNKP